LHRPRGATPTRRDEQKDQDIDNATDVFATRIFLASRDAAQEIRN
jgi:hypothetical protein